MVSSHVRFRPDVEGLRGLAILAILVFHAAPEWFPPGGFAGVDVFFVISGFVVGRTVVRDLATDRFSLEDFYRRRVRRLFPALFVVLVVTMVVAPFMMSKRDFIALGQQSAAAALFTGNLLAWRRSGYFELAASYKPLIHLWSLGVEEQ